MKVYRWFVNFDKEEKWLEQMSLQGFHLKEVTVFGMYHFEKGNPEKRKYRIDYRVFPTKDDLKDYIALFKDSGWNCASSSVKNGGQYFYSIENNSNEDIFSDNTSKAERDIRLARYLGSSFLIMLLPYLSLWLTGTLKVGSFEYLTPGLWEMKGLNFIKAFLFETPFVLFRSTSALLPLGLIIIPIFLYIRGYWAYKRALEADAG